MQPTPTWTPTPPSDGRSLPVWLKVLAIPALAVTLLGLTSVAFAAWTSKGTGIVQVSAGTSTDSRIAPAGVGEALYPGAVKAATITVDNPNPYPVVLTYVSAGASEATASGCPAGAVTTEALGAPTSELPIAQVGGDTVIAPGGAATYEITTRMAATATDACKTQAFDVALQATLLSAA